MRTKFSGILTLLLVLVVQLTFAQEKTISGTVTDNVGLPLPGVNIIVKGTTNGTQSDFDGNYSIQAAVGQRLTFSYVGFSNVENAVGTSNSMSVTMREDAAQLEEVVVTALGIKKKKKDDLTSSTLVKAEDITKSGEIGVATALAGKTSGVNVIKSSGDPGAGSFIQIRGANTILGSDEPLYVIDGVLINNTNNESGVAGVSEQSRLNDFSSEDIESVTVIKGASAVAVYGTGAANGVIVINTKSGKGKIGEWSFNYKSGIYLDHINRLWDLQDTFGQGTNGSFVNGGQVSWGDLISARSGAPDELNLNGAYFVAQSGNTYYNVVSGGKNSRETFLESNKDAVLGTGLTQEHDMSLKYSGANGSTFISANSWDQQGIIKNGSSYVRKSFRLNNTTVFSDKLRSRVSASYVKTNADAVQSGSNLSGFFLGFLRNPSDFDIRDYKGSAFNADGTLLASNSQRAFRGPVGPTAAYNNPLWTINEQVDTKAVDRFLISPELTYDFSDNVSVTARYSMDSYRDKRLTFFPYYSASDLGNGEGYLDSDSRFYRTEYFTAFLNSNHTLSEKFNFSWITGITYENNDFEQIGGIAVDFSNPFVTLADLIDVANAPTANSNPYNRNTYSKQVGAYLLVEGELFNQVLFSLTGRVDRSSTLPDETFFYPAASIGWKFTEALGDNNFLSFGKLRATYGEVATAPVPYSLSSGYNGGQVVNAVGDLGIGSSWGDFLIGSQYGNLSSFDDTQGNPKLVVERVKEFEVGTDLSFVNNRVNFGFTYYDRKTEDVLLPQNVSSASGFSELINNAATITNKGYELDLSATIVKTEDFSWTLGLNFSTNENLVTTPNGNGENITDLNGFVDTTSSVVDGQPLGVLFGIGLYRLENGEIYLNEFGFPSTTGSLGSDAQPEMILGDPNPDWRGGLSTVIKYKGVEISALFDTMQGNDVWNGTRGVLNHFGVTEETANQVTVSSAEAATIVNYVGTSIADLPNAQLNPDGTYTVRGNLKDFGQGTVLLDQAWYNGGTASGFAGASELYIEDGSYVKLREISLGYTLPSSLIEPIGLESLNFSISGRNLATWTDIEGFDPDNNLTGASKGRGLEYFTNPSTASYFFTLRVGI